MPPTLASVPTEASRPTVHAVLSPAAFDQARVGIIQIGDRTKATNLELAGIQFRVSGMRPWELAEALNLLATQVLIADADAQTTNYCWCGDVAEEGSSTCSSFACHAFERQS